MFSGRRHLDENALIRRYLADRGLEVLNRADEPLLRHLAQCAPCQARYRTACSALDEGRELSIEHADAAFAPDRLARQRERIMRRVEAHAHGPRILPFPATAPADRAPFHTRVVMRWAAAAAVAGLVVGLGAGRFLRFEDVTNWAVRHARADATAGRPSSPRPTPVLRAVGPAPVLAGDDDFLSQVDLAVSEPHTAELRAIYAFTLQERDVPGPLKY